MDINTKILTLDVAGNPRKWSPVEEVAEYYAKNKIAWEIGEHSFTLRGGIQRVSGKLSEITVRSIVAIKGTDHLVRKSRTPILSRRLLFAMHQNQCGYCGQYYDVHQLELEHIVPRAQGGKNTWSNLIPACLHCNDIKGNRTPEQADMPLLLTPYIPSRHEELLLLNRTALRDQQEFLLSKVKNLKLHTPRNQQTCRHQ